MTLPNQGTDQAYEPVDNSRPTAAEVTNRSIGDLMRQVTEDLSTLMRKEVELAKAEVREEGKKAGKAAGFYGGAGFGGYMVALFLSLALAAGLSNVMDAGWAALIVAIIWGVIAAVLYSMARSNTRRIQGLKQTQETAKRIPQALKPEKEGVVR
jgi:Putative Actinobacterial Holin-X, holin superfamily III